MAHPEEEALRQWCDRLWQRHEARGWTAEPWPDRAAYRRHWPLLADDLIEADYLVANAGTESRLVPWTEIDPPEPEGEPDWRRKWREELEEHPWLLLALEQSLEVAMQRAGVPGQRQGSAERDALRLWLGGDSLSEIARQLSRTLDRTIRKSQVQRWVESGRERLRSAVSLSA